MKIDNIECPNTNLEDLVASWRILYPTMTEEEISHITETAKRLIPDSLNFVLEKNEAKDYSKKILLAAKKDQQILLV